MNRNYKTNYYRTIIIIHHSHFPIKKLIRDLYSSLKLEKERKNYFCCKLIVYFLFLSYCLLFIVPKKWKKMRYNASFGATFALIILK